MLLGRSVCVLVRSYLAGIRPDWVGADRDKHLFLNRWGRGMEPNAVCRWCTSMQARRPREAGVAHTFRHVCATHMLRNGAPIRQLQERLGHAYLTTTQLYIRVTINDLRAMHSRFHPREQGQPAD